MTASEKNKITEDTYLVGIGVSPGIAIGRTYLLNRARTVVVEREVPPGEVPAEGERFRKALADSRAQLEQVKARVDGRQLREHLYIIDTHLLILNDQMLIGDTLGIIEKERICAEGALKRTLDKFRAVFDSIEDEYLRERRSDIDSVGERLLRNLTGVVQHSLADIDRKAIVVAHDLSPADTMQMDKGKIHGFVTDVGGRTSHTAILARSLGIPAVVGLETASVSIPDDLPVIIDGTAGTVVLNPSPQTFREYLDKKQHLDHLERELESYRDLAAETLDRFRLTLKVNVELTGDVEVARQQGAEGVGLFRTEFLYLNRPKPPTEEEQVRIYSRIIEEMAPHPVTIRTLDLGGDKFSPEIDLSDESNPALGLRGVRFSLKEVRLFQTQLRAILRASTTGPVRIMFPMVAGVAEVRQCRFLLEEAKAELTAEGLPFDGGIKVGIMIETPSAAFIADLLAREVDFFSVGTNDLIQYCLAVDRGNEHVAYLYEPLHPAILRALKGVCDAAEQAGIPIGICGEMASEPLYILALLGLGFRELSMNAFCIPRVKRIVRQVSRQDGVDLLKELLTLSTAEEVLLRIEEEMARRFPDLFGAPLI